MTTARRTEPARRLPRRTCPWAADPTRDGSVAGRAIMVLMSLPSVDRAPDGLDPAARLQDERSALLARLMRLADDMSGLFAASRDSNSDDEHDPEGQTIAYERSQLAAVTVQAREHLAEVEAALERVASGGYGICEVCHGTIDAARLEARPAARTCIGHLRGATT